MGFWDEILAPENFNWLVVLIIGTAATTLGTALTNGVTVRRPHNDIRLWSEALVNQHLTYIAFFPALIAARDLREWYKNWCFAVMFISFVFFAIGLLNIRKHEGVIKRDHAPCDDDCGTDLSAISKSRIVKLNWLLAGVALVFTLVLIFSLQFGMVEGKQRRGKMDRGITAGQGHGDGSRANSFGCALWA